MNLPLRITYETQGLTPVADVIASLQATEMLAKEAIALLPSLIPGLEIRQSSINVRQLTQESPLRELFLLTLIVAYQDSLDAEVPPLIENLLGVEIGEKYDSLATIVFMIVVFYGLSFAKDALSKAVFQGHISATYDEAAEDLEEATGLPRSRVRAILEARFGKPNLMRRLAKNAVQLFVPSKREGSAAVTIDRKRIEPPVVAEIPYPSEITDTTNFEKYDPYTDTEIIIHAQDRDKNSTGWAAVAPEVADRRVRLKLIPPISPSDLWGKDRVFGDIVVISELTQEGFRPTEIHLTSIR